MYTIYFTKQAKKEVTLLHTKEKMKLKKIVTEVLTVAPYSGKKLIGNLAGNYSYRLNVKDRIVYEINEDAQCIYIKRVRTHYGE